MRSMNFMDGAGAGRLEHYFHGIGEILGSPQRRSSFALYAMGLFSAAERKSVEPLAVHACPDPSKADAAHQRLLHFIVDSEWSDHEVRRAAAALALAAMTEQAPVEAWIVDDTGFLKQGKHSVGVQRQYTGSAGKIANCQIGVSLTVATRTEQLPIDFRLYLPECWANDAARRREARIPAAVEFQTKPDLALSMIRRALADDIPRGVVLADSAYGTSSDFRQELRRLGLRYIVAVNPTTNVEPVDEREPVPISVRDLAAKLDAEGAFRRCTWREGTGETLWARFAMCRVRVSANEKVSLLIEWRDGEPEPANYFFASFPRHTRKKKLVRLAMQRWRTERAYQDLKGELGLDHYEGRRFPGWQHHVSVALACYAFIVAERSRHFPPAARRSLAHGKVSVAA
jgi:SRSO17 transposase